MTETLNGLHICQPKNEPKEGEVKNLLVVNMPPRNGKKGYIKIKNELPEKGGAPYRIVSVSPTGWEPDSYGNSSYNLEIEPVNGGDATCNRQNLDPKSSIQTSGSSNAAPTSKPEGAADGIMEAKKHLMQSSNLYCLCVDAVEKVVWPHLVAYSQKDHSDWLTCDLYQAVIATLYIESSRAGMVAKMPEKPI